MISVGFSGVFELMVWFGAFVASATSGRAPFGLVDFVGYGASGNGGSALGPAGQFFFWLFSTIRWYIKCFEESE